MNPILEHIKENTQLPPDTELTRGGLSNLTLTMRDQHRLYINLLANTGIIEVNYHHHGTYSAKGFELADPDALKDMISYTEKVSKLIYDESWDFRED